jgi:hypothetical protein
MTDDEPTTDLLDPIPHRRIDDMTVRRLRQRILDDVAARAIPPRRSLRPWALAIPAVVALVIGLGVASWPARHAREQPSTNTISVFTDDDPTARWARHADLASEWVELSDGRFRVEIHQHPATRRVMVTVPDGQIDHLGTIFDVVISDCLTTHLVVVEGRVAVHLRGRADVILAAGERWDRAVAREPEGASRSVGDGSASAVHTSVGSADTAAASPSRAKTNGRLRRAKPLIPDAAAVAQEAEDAAYLTVIRLLRASRAPEAKAAAREYLRRFPAGFRREEISALTK